METRRSRTIIRGRFPELDAKQRAVLLVDVDNHGALKAAFTEDGTLTYDRTLKFFGFRYQFDVIGELAEACDLEARGLEARDGNLTVSVTCMSEMRTERRKAPKHPRPAIA